MIPKARNIVDALRAQPALATPTPLPPMETNPLQTALDDYHRMAAEVEMVRANNRDLITENSKLIAEMNMLRESYERADSDRIRLQAIASTLLGRLFSINDVIAGAVKQSVKDGLQAVDVAEVERALGAARERPTEPAEGTLPKAVDLDAARPLHSPRAPQEASGAIPPQVDWRRGEGT